MSEDDDCPQLTEPTFNLKCIVLTAILALGYWFLPKKSLIVLALIVYGSYLALAWYDYIYDCRRRLGPTYLSTFYLPFKPPLSCQVRQYYSFPGYVKSKIFFVDMIVLLIVVAVIAVTVTYKKYGK